MRNLNQDIKWKRFTKTTFHALPIERENSFTMKQFAESINEFLEFRKYNILKDNGSITKQKADEKAIAEYTEFNKTQKIVSDFDREIKS